MNNDLLNDMVLSINKQNLHVLNVIVRQNGKIIARHDFEKEKPTLLWSVSKTFTSMAVGIAISEGYFKVDDKVIVYFPEVHDTQISENYKDDYSRFTLHGNWAYRMPHSKSR